MIPILSSNSRERRPTPLQPECMPRDGSKPIDSESLYMASVSSTISSLGTPNIMARFTFSSKSASGMVSCVTFRRASSVMFVSLVNVSKACFKPFTSV